VSENLIMQTKTCSACGATGEKSTLFPKSGSQCKACCRERQQKYIDGLKEKGLYEALVKKHQQARNKQKQEARRAKGCRLKGEIHSEAEKKRQGKVDVALARERFKAEFVGPPTANSVCTKAEYRRWRYQNNDQVRKYQIEKRHRYVTKVTTSYARERLRCKSAGAELIEAKRLHLLIKRGLKNEEHNRTSQ